jgi:COP9 signalosome complex subunit 4
MADPSGTTALEASITQRLQSCASDPSSAQNTLLTIIRDVFSPSANLGSNAIRQVVQSITQILTTLPPESCITVGEAVLEAFGTSPAAADREIMELRLLLATAYEAEEEWLAAARQLSSIPLDSSQLRQTANEKAAILIRIVRLHLQLGDSLAASAYLNKFKNLMHEVDDPILAIHFQLSQARIHDAECKFLEAAKEYADLSVSAQGTLAPEEAVQTLGAAAKCAVLAPAGPARQAVLARLYADERLGETEEYGVVEAMYLERLIAPSAITTFAQRLDEHQLAKRSDGRTVLEHAVGEHNLRAAARLYKNIKISRLAEIIGVGEEQAEVMVAGMVEQGRLAGRIDQIEGVVWFEVPGPGGVLGEWDANVRGLTEGVERVAAEMGEKYPVSWIVQGGGSCANTLQEFVAKHLVV